MAKDDQRTLTPRLRFPEFRKEKGWEETSLGSEATFQKGRGVSKADVDPNGNRLCIRYGELYTRYGEVIDDVNSRTNAPESSLFLSRENDVIIPASGETKEDIAKASCVTLDGVALGSDLNVIRTKHNGRFLSYLLNGPKRREIAKVAQGDTVVHLHPSQLTQLPIAFPKKEEQQKIADCLTSLDELIAAQGRKVEALKAHKKGLMQQLFPGEGRTLPRLRFPEFRKAPEWEMRTLEDVAEVNPSRVTVANDTPVTFLPMSAVSETGRVETSVERPFIEVKRGYTFFRENDIIIAKITPCFENGKAALLRGLQNGIGLGSTEFHVIRAGISCSPDFLFSCLYTDEFRRSGAASMTGSAGQQRVPASFLEGYKFSVPEPTEQHRIAACLSSLDARIGAETEKLAALKTHKQGLLQQLFPSPETV